MKKRNPEATPAGWSERERELLSDHEQRRLRWSDLQRKSRKQKRHPRGFDLDERLAPPQRAGGRP